MGVVPHESVGEIAVASAGIVETFLPASPQSVRRQSLTHLISASFRSRAPGPVPGQLCRAAAGARPSAPFPAVFRPLAFASWPDLLISIGNQLGDRGEQARLGRHHAPPAPR